MAFRKHVMISIVLLCVSGLLFGCGDDNSVTPATTTDEAPMVAPANVNAVLLANGAIELTWSSNSQPHFKGYNVYRLDHSAGAIGKINPDLLTVNHYVDTEVGHDRYEYWVTAVSVKGAESAPSPTAIIDVPISTGKGRDREIR